jgi:hypothetical protein
MTETSVSADSVKEQLIALYKLQQKRVSYILADEGLFSSGELRPCVSYKYNRFFRAEINQLAVLAKVIFVLEKYGTLSPTGNTEDLSDDVAEDGMSGKIVSDIKSASKIAAKLLNNPDAARNLLYGGKHEPTPVISGQPEPGTGPAQPSADNQCVQSGTKPRRREKKTKIVGPQ